jgi:hypothetical protein
MSTTSITHHSDVIEPNGSSIFKCLNEELTLISKEMNGRVPIQLVLAQSMIAYQTQMEGSG